MDQTQTFDPRKPVRTRSGYAARIVCIDRADTFPIIALFTRPDNGAEQLIAAGADGRITHEEHPLDLVNVPDGEATYPVNPLIQLLADPSPDEFREILKRVREAMAAVPGGLSDENVALALVMGMMQMVRARVSLPPVFADAAKEMVRLRDAATDARLRRRSQGAPARRGEQEG
ncbi:hypothetical protein [Azospirillum sp.]|uniref:hypothetical protein n=1 Tax=Azospirillum sp. TaxID=34012 RepID=UPI003D720B84